MGFSKFGSLFLACLLGSFASGQTVPDLSKDPRLQQVVSLHLKRTMLSDLSKVLKKNSNQQFSNQWELDSLMVCVFVDKEPLWKVMTGVANVTECEWHDSRGIWRLQARKESTKRLLQYVSLEKIALQNDILAKAQALAKNVSGGRTEIRTGEVKVVAQPDEETNEQWAARQVSQPAYYIAGIMFRDSPVIGMALHTSQLFKDDCFDNFTAYAWPQAYRLIAPPNQALAELCQCGVPADMPVEFSGNHVVVRSLPWAGTLQAVLIDHGIHQVVRPRHRIKYPFPIGDLAKSEPGKWLLNWETPLKDSTDPMLDDEVKGISPTPTDFFQKQHGIEEYLEGLFESNHRPIISDAFRYPTIGREPPSSASSLREWLNLIRQSQKCFVRIENGCILIRHGGFWDLRNDTISEVALREFEKIKDPDLMDYADFACQNRQNVMDGIPAFFETQDLPLTRFNSKPFRDSYPTLMAFGKLNEDDRQQLLGGNIVNTIKPVITPKYFKRETLVGKDLHGKPVEVDNSHWEGSKILDWIPDDNLVFAEASLGPFYGGQTFGAEKRLLEDYRHPASYLHLWGDSPYDVPGFVQKYGFGMETHAHDLMLKSRLPQSKPINENLRSIHYGRYEFFAGISDVDGMLTIVEIPDPTVGGQ